MTLYQNFITAQQIFISEDTKLMLLMQILNAAAILLHHMVLLAVATWGARLLSS